MRSSLRKWLIAIWMICQVGLLCGCFPVSTQTPPIASAVKTVLPTPVQTRGVRLTPTQTLTPVPTRTPTLPPSLLDVEISELRGVEVEFWHTATGSAGEYLDTLTAEFNRENSWGIKVQPVSFAGMGILEEEVYMALSERRLPGMIAAYSEQAQRWDASGTLLMDLTPYVNDPAWGLSTAEQQDFYPHFWDHDLMLRRKGASGSDLKRLGVPWYRTGLVMLYNRTWARELGYRSVPDTADKFRQQVCAAAKANEMDVDRLNNGTGGWLVTDDPMLFVGWIHAFEGDIKAANDMGYTFNTPEAERSVQYLVGLIADGCAWTSEDELPVDAFAARRALAWIGSLSSLPQQQQALEQSGNSDEWIILPFPVTGDDPVIETYGPALSVLKSTPARELAAWLFARWLVSVETQARWAEAAGVFPVSAAAVNQERTGGKHVPQWEQALQWLPYAWNEPALPSWGVMRGALRDTWEQILTPGFQAGQAAALLDTLDQIAAEIVAQVR